MKTDAALNNLATKIVAGAIAKNPKDVDRTLASLLAAIFDAMRAQSACNEYPAGPAADISSSTAQR